MLGLHASRAFCFLLLGTGTHVFANITDDAVAKPNNLRHLLSDAFVRISLNANPAFEACSADEDCADCLEIDTPTHCKTRDIGAINAETCGDTREVICCVFENDQACMTNDYFRDMIASLERVCTMDLPCLGDSSLDDFAKLANSGDKVERDAGELNAVDEATRGTGAADASGTALQVGSSSPGLKVVVALSFLLLATGRVLL